MQEAHALGLAVLGEAAVERRGMIVRLKQVRVLAKMRVPVGMVNECVLEAVRLLNGREPGIELFGFSDSCGETAAKLALAITTNARHNDDLHERAGGEQDDLLPHSSAFLLADCVDLIENDTTR